MQQEKMRAELTAYGEKYQLRGLEGRLQRGLDPAGMIAYSGTKKLVEKLCEKLHVSLDSLIEVTNKLHVGALWEMASKFKEVTPEIQLWLVLAEACNDGRSDLDWEAFLEDTHRVELALEYAMTHLEDVQHTVHMRIQNAQKAVVLHEGIAYVEGSRFLDAAIAGYHVAISMRDDSYQVGAKSLDFQQVAQKFALIPVEKEDRGRKAVFYQDSEGKDHIKVVYPGLGIVLTKDEAMARALAESAY